MTPRFISFNIDPRPEPFLLEDEMYCCVFRDIVASLLRDARTQEGLTVDQASKLTGGDACTIEMLERGETSVNTTDLYLYLRRLGYTLFIDIDKDT